MDRHSEITELLEGLEGSGTEAVDLLFERLYDDLRPIAARRLASERDGHTLSATALVSEVYLKLVDLDRLDWKNRAQFFAVATRVMRQILSNHARDRAAAKRGGGATHVTLQPQVAGGGAVAQLSWDDVLTIETALEALESLDERQARVAEMRLFGEMTNADIATALSISVPTVERDWRVARAFLARSLE